MTDIPSNRKICVAGEPDWLTFHHSGGRVSFQWFIHSIRLFSIPTARVRIYAQGSIYGLWATTRRSFQSNLGQQSLISFIHPSCTAMPTSDCARHSRHDPYAQPCRCLACRRMRWTFPKAGYRCIAYCQSRPCAYLAYDNTHSRSTYQIMHTIHHLSLIHI